MEAYPLQDGPIAESAECAGRLSGDRSEERSGRRARDRGRSFLAEPPRMFRLYEVPGYDCTLEVPTGDTTIGWGLEFADGAVSVLVDEANGLSVGLHRDAKDAAALYSMVSSVGVEYVLTA